MLRVVFGMMYSLDRMMYDFDRMMYDSSGTDVRYDKMVFSHPRADSPHHCCLRFSAADSVIHRFLSKRAD